MMRWAGIALGVLVAILLVAGAGELSVRTATCKACHSQEAKFANWMTDRLKAEKKGFGHELIGCADCHIEGGAARTPMSRLRGLLHAAKWLVPQIDPRTPRVSGLFNKTRVPRENCQYCHKAAQVRKAMFLKDLPEGLKKIGLAMDHRKHVIARDDTCAKCHERYKDPLTGQADKGVNYAEVNHLACDSCHTAASHSYRTGLIFPVSGKTLDKAEQEAWDRLAKNPRWMVALPTEKTCRRCHNGQIHFKSPIFLADCRVGTNYDNCVKCHPLMTRDYFEQYKKERDKVESARKSAQEPHADGTAAAREAKMAMRTGVAAAEDR